MINTSFGLVERLSLNIGDGRNPSRVCDACAALAEVKRQYHFGQARRSDQTFD